MYIYDIYTFPLKKKKKKNINKKFKQFNFTFRPKFKIKNGQAQKTFKMLIYLTQLTTCIAYTFYDTALQNGDLNWGFYKIVCID